jgi:hypothetical protein
MNKKGNMTDLANSNNSQVHEPLTKKAVFGGSVFPSITLTDYFITKENLTPGFEGTRQTLAAMAALVRGEYPPDFIGYQSESIRRAALHICQQSPGHNFQSEIESLFIYVRDSIAYRLDPINTERLQDAQQTLNTGAGDCDDKCILLASLLAALGHVPRFVAQSSDGLEFDHVYVQVLIGGQWLNLDPTADGKAGLPLAGPGWSNQAKSQWSYTIFF